VMAGECFLSIPTPAVAAIDDFTQGTLGTFHDLVSQPESPRFEAGLLESRVESNALDPPSYGMEGTDIFYPS
jgi:hypothetical protein